MYDKITLYTKQGVKFRQWSVWTEGAEVIVEHGQWGGKLTQKRYTAEPKNVGRANATTAEEQAIQEADAKVVKQLKSGYYYTIEEAADHVEFTPMKANDYKDFAHKVEYPCIVQPKLNGQRLMIDKDGIAWSKQGEPLELPKHWSGLREAAIELGGMDGEVYAGLESEGGLSLQQIISAFRKPNENTEKLQYWMYDLPWQTNQQTRYNAIIGHYYNEGLPDCVVIDATGKEISSEEEGDAFYQECVQKGFEGVVYRNKKANYEFGKRSYNLIKRKPRFDAEAVVVSVTQDKNGDGVLLCQAINGKQTGVQFECLMRKDAHPEINYRKYSNALLLIGKAISYEYEELADDTDKGRGKPTKPVGVGLREMIGNEGRY